MLLGQHPEIGLDLKKVATDRMSQVKEKNPKAIDENLEESEDDLVQETSSQSKEAESIYQLQNSMNVEARKLSLTSGTLQSGNYKKADEKTIAKLNENESDLLKNNYQSPCNETEDTGACIHQSFEEMFISLNASQRKAIHTFVASSVSTIVEDKMKQIIDILSSKNKVLVQKIINHIQETKQIEQ